MGNGKVEAGQPGQFADDRASVRNGTDADAAGGDGGARQGGYELRNVLQDALWRWAVGTVDAGEGLSAPMNGQPAFGIRPAHPGRCADDLPG